MPDFSQSLGRRHTPDDRDARYPIRLLLDPLRDQFFPTGIPQGTRHYRQGPVLDQGQTGTCVAHGWCGWAYGAPLMSKRTDLPLPYDLYRLIVKDDEYPDNDNEVNAPDDQLQAGTSVRAGVQELRKLGHVKNFLWAKTTEEVRAWTLAGLGGVVLGINWTEDMFTPDAQGIIRYTGAVAGGHCIKTTGWTDTLKVNGRTQRAARALNSWGRSWGQSGRMWILEEDLQRLLDDDGECCAATEQKVTPIAA